MCWRNPHSMKIGVIVQFGSIKIWFCPILSYNKVYLGLWGAGGYGWMELAKLRWELGGMY